MNAHMESVFLKGFYEENFTAIYYGWKYECLHKIFIFL